ncbi:MAG: amidohydrolase [Candidatus Marinimicrobia bacterium]|nr:amidohydrolase [Candidatus Neomarinimicrobiota bacterium]MBT7377684.1 amidohydrolase [Candidatus Neomarinimicrobiota bacterium]
MRNLLIFLGISVVGYFIIIIHNSDNFIPNSSQLYYNGNILTMEDNVESPEAVYIENGIIKAIGDKHTIEKKVKQNTTPIDLKGKTLMPGFIDPHTHPVASAFLYGMIDLSGFKHDSKEAVWSHLEKSISQYKPNEWILCKGFDQVLVDGLDPPNINYLDSIAPNNPIFIASLPMHSYWANTLAFQAAGISKHSPNPSESSFYEKDYEGNLTGYISEQEAFKPFKESMILALGNDMLKENCVKVLDAYAQNGNTTITAMGITTDDPNIIRLYNHLSSERSSFLNKLLSQVGLLPKRKPSVRHFVFIRNDASELLPLSINNGDDFFKIVGVKFWYDGSPYTGSMYIDDPYLESDLTIDKLHFPHSHSGVALLDKDEFSALISSYDSHGWQIATHAQGDMAIQEILDIFQEADLEMGKDSRHRLEHCLLLEESSIQKMEKLNIHPSFHINHLYYYGEALAENIIGEKRAAEILPVGTAEDHSLRYSLHADQPMFASNPLSLIHTAVNRKTRDGKLIGPHNKVTVESALKAMTIYSAWQIKMDDKIGSIEVGKYADFVILEKNPLEVLEDKIKYIQVIETIVNGNTIFKLDTE